MEFLIRFFVFRYLLPSCFLTKETPEKLANVFGSDFKNQFFHHYKAFDLDTWRNELNLQKQIKNIHKFEKISCSLKKTTEKSKEDGKYKKREFKSMIRRSDWYLNFSHKNTYRILAVVIIKTKTKNLWLSKKLICKCKKRHELWF